MKSNWLFLILIFTSFQSISQEKLEVQGAITVGELANNNPTPGTIQWNGTDFLGWDGFKWKSLTQMITYDGTVMDVDSNIYPTIVIGEQEWMASNLKTGKYDNGDPIELELFGGWTLNSTGAYCWYGDREVYGYLYNWFAADNPKGLCPSGWKVPSNAEWDELFDFLDGNSNNIVGGKLKEKRTAHWLSPNNGATNEVGFTALPAGMRTETGTFQNLYEYGRFWSKSESSPGSSLASRKYMWSEAYELNGGNVDKNNGYSIRCMRDIN